MFLVFGAKVGDFFKKQSKKRGKNASGFGKNRPPKKLVEIIEIRMIDF